MITMRRSMLASLRDSAPPGVDQLMACAIGCYDRWEWIDAANALHDAVMWAEDHRWRARAFALLAMMHADMADAELENMALDAESRKRE